LARIGGPTRGLISLNIPVRIGEQPERRYPNHHFSDSGAVLRVEVIPTGEALIDFVFGKSSDNRATVARLVLTRESTQILKTELVKSENIADEPGLTRGQRSMN
jgi:hypothetical protein